MKQLCQYIGANQSEKSILTPYFYKRGAWGELQAKKGFSLVELMLVASIFVVLFGATLAVLVNSDRYWRIGQRKLTEQQEARKALDEMARLLRQSNPDWVINGTHYPLTITAGNRIDFYQPVFDGNGEISSLRKITFKLNPDDTSQLLKKEGTLNAAIIANNVTSVNFGGGCAGCAAFNCAALAADCPVVAIDLVTRSEAGFNLSSRITLRNTNITLGAGVEVEQPSEGEF